MTTLAKNPDFRFLVKHPAYFLGLGFGSGLAKKAPGTVGTLVGFPLFWCISTQALSMQLAIIAVLFIMGVYFCDATGKALGVADHGSIVWDEIVAMLLVLTFTPDQWQYWIIAFIFFRLFDIWKPIPIRQFDQKLKNGFGVMFDDLLAALYSILGLKVIIWFTMHG